MIKYPIIFFVIRKGEERERKRNIKLFLKYVDFRKIIAAI